MTYPPDVPPATRTNSTLSADTHPGDHNKLAAAIADVLAELGTNPSGGYSDLTARLAAIGSGGGGGVTLVEDPPGSGFYTPSGGTLTEDPTGSGLFIP